MKVCFLTSGGFSVLYVQDFGRKLVARGHEVAHIDVCSEPPMESSPAWRTVEGIRFRRIILPYRPWLFSLNSYFILRTYRRAVAELMPDADVLHGFPFYIAGISAVWLGRRIGASAVVRDGSSIPYLRWIVEGRLRRMAVRWALRKATGVYVDHPSLVEFFRALGREPALIRNPVDMEMFSPGAEAPSSFVLLNLGRQEPFKGLTVVLDALPAVLQEAPETQLRFVGDGGQRQLLRRRARELGLERQVEFRTFVPFDEVPQVMRECAVFLQPSVEPETPNTVLQAMACGCPVVCTPLVGYTDLLRDGETALVVPAGSVSALAQAILRLLKDSGLRRKLGQNARREAVEHLSWERHIESVLRLCTRPPQPRRQLGDNG